MRKPLPKQRKGAEMNMLENHMTQGNADAFALRSDADQKHHEAEVKRAAKEKLTRADWWNTQLEGTNGTTGAAPQALARAMENLNRACLGDQISTRAVLAALSILQRAAMVDAIAEAEGEVE